MPMDPGLVQAAINILQQSLSLSANQNLLILADEGSLDIADVLTAAADSLSVHATTLYVPRLLQVRFREGDELYHLVEQAIQEADAIFSALSDRPEHTAYRAQVVQTGSGLRRRTVHAPGLTLQMLRMAQVDFEQINRRCQQVAAALVLHREIRVETQDRHGNPYQLCVHSGQWEHPPSISNGMILEGEWANLPPGETFLVPQGGDGQIVINGSIPGRVLAPEEELILNFEKGWLTGIGPAESLGVQDLQRHHLEPAQAAGDDKWRNLAEIGFGVNPAITRLAGVELIDEKKAGTLHIALGRSDLLGGAVYATIHVDLVVERPTVYVDGEPILLAGRWHLDQALPSYRTSVVPDGWWAGVSQLRRSGSRAEVEAGRLIRHWGSGSGRRSSMPVGSDETAVRAAQLYALLPGRDLWMEKPVLLKSAGRLGLDEATLPPLLWILYQYDLIRVKGDDS